jgi:mannose-6-phosphate isomerase-like protein (cupin superfamily)
MSFPIHLNPHIVSSAADSADATSPALWQSGAEFHQQGSPIYRGDPESAAVYKQASGMAHVCYSPAHANPAASGPGAGQGNNYCIWVAGEQGTQAEGISRSALDGILDSYLEPHASIGWHTHHHSEETYYLLAGHLTVEMQDTSGQQGCWRLQPGDSHRVGPGMSHTAQAGEEGARFIAVMLRC